MNNASKSNQGMNNNANYAVYYWFGFNQTNIYLNVNQLIAAAFHMYM